MGGGKYHKDGYLVCWCGVLWWRTVSKHQIEANNEVQQAMRLENTHIYSILPELRVTHIH